MLLQICLLLKIPFFWVPSHFAIIFDHPFFSLKWIAGAAGAGKSGLNSLERFSTTISSRDLNCTDWFTQENQGFSLAEKIIQHALVFNSYSQRFPLHCCSRCNSIIALCESCKNWVLSGQLWLINSPPIFNKIQPNFKWWCINIQKFEKVINFPKFWGTKWWK